MRTRTSLVAAAAVVGVSLAGCTAEPGPRATGGPITRAEAATLADLLHRNHRAGGADFVVTAPYRDGVVLTLTGEVDFRNGEGRAQAVTTFGTDREDDVRTLFFTADDVWTGDVPGLQEALTDAGDPTARYLRRELAAAGDDGEPLLVDVLLTLLLRLSAPAADDRESFGGRTHTWEGQRSIDSRLTTLYGLPDERTVAVSADEGLLVQFSTPLLDGAFDATVTLSEHGPRSVELPDDEQTAEAADHPGPAEAAGV